MHIYPREDLCNFLNKIKHWVEKHPGSQSSIPFDYWGEALLQMSSSHASDSQMDLQKERKGRAKEKRKENAFLSAAICLKKKSGILWRGQTECRERETRSTDRYIYLVYFCAASLFSAHSSPLHILLNTNTKASPDVRQRPQTKVLLKFFLLLPPLLWLLQCEWNNEIYYRAPSATCCDLCHGNIANILGYINSLSLISKVATGERLSIPHKAAALFVLCAT